MIRPIARMLWPLALLVLVFSWRALGCRKKELAKHAAAPQNLITSRFTAPPPLPTTTMWPGATRVPALPE